MSSCWSSVMSTFTYRTAKLPEPSLQERLLDREAASASDRAVIQGLRDRVESLEGALDEVNGEIEANEAARAAAERRAAEARLELQVARKVSQSHVEDLRAKMEEVVRKDDRIELLEAIFKTVCRK